MENKKLKEIVFDKIMEVLEIKDGHIQMSLKNDLGIHSLELINLIVCLEDFFNIEFTDDFLLQNKFDIIENIVEEIILLIGDDYDK